MKNNPKLQRILTVVGIVLCVILVPILVLNCILIVKSIANKNEVPGIGKTVPLIVLSDSMYPDIKTGDMIFCKRIDPDDVEVGDTISFYDPSSKSSAIVTHRVEEIIEENGVRYFKTKGINNNTADRVAVSETKVIAEYHGARIPWVGSIAMFMQSPAGLVVCVVVPIVLLIGIDVLRRRSAERDQGDDVAALRAELEALKAARATPSAEEDESSDKDAE